MIITYYVIMIAYEVNCIGLHTTKQHQSVQRWEVYPQGL